MAVSTAERQKAHRALFRAKLDDGFVESLRAATNGGWALGDARHQRRIARTAGRRTAPLLKGRPPKDEKDGRQPNLF